VDDIRSMEIKNKTNDLCSKTNKSPLIVSTLLLFRQIFYRKTQIINCDVHKYNKNQSKNLEELEDKK